MLHYIYLFINYNKITYINICIYIRNILQCILHNDWYGMRDNVVKLRYKKADPPPNCTNPVATTFFTSSSNK